MKEPSTKVMEPDDADASTNERQDNPCQLDSGDSREAIWQQIRSRRGQKKFRNALRKRHGDSCMISGCPLLDVLEAAHIKPYRGKSDHHIANGLLLRADLHTLFDLDLLGIEPKTLTIRFHPKVLDAGYREFDGITLRSSKLSPSTEALNARWANFLRGLKDV